MKKILFTDDFNVFSNNAFIAVLEKTKSKRNLLEELNKQLHFPSYFGFNWDALSDCLRDFHWLENKEIVLVHKEIPRLDKSELIKYLKVLIDAANDWKEGESHYFTVVFPNESKPFINTYLAEIQ